MVVLAQIRHIVPLTQGPPAGTPVLRSIQLQSGSDTLCVQVDQDRLGALRMNDWVLAAVPLDEPQFGPPGRVELPRHIERIERVDPSIAERFGLKTWHFTP